MISCDGRRGRRPHDSGGGDFVQQGTPPPFLDVCNRPTTTNVGWWCDGERKRESSGGREREREAVRERVRGRTTGWSGTAAHGGSIGSGGGRIGGGGGELRRVSNSGKTPLLFLLNF
ncbi:hypothetical protein HanIR_Chr15g0773771 [Helianthus annuus]|nr:hypothetical protein HanIR_Chr15g0773771 [Helianthus annuus]